MTTSRLINRSDDIAVFYSKDKFDQVKMNAGSGMSFLPAVQDLTFGFDGLTKKNNYIGSKEKSFTYPNQAPDISLDISILENFETLFEDAFTGGNIVEDLDNGKNFYFLISTDEERTALSKYKSSISVGNCFLDSINISQSVNGVLKSDYSYIGSNILAQEYSGSNNEYLSSSGKAPSVDLTGDQQPIGNFVFADIKKEISTSNYYGEFTPGCKTFVKISGIGTDTSFLIKPDGVQSFNLGIKFNRKRINSVDKFFPMGRKATPPFLGNISIENKFSDIEVGGSFINFLKNPDEYHISISGEKSNGKSFMFDISKAFLQKKDINGSISSSLSEKADFIFGLEDGGTQNAALLTDLTSIATWSQNNGTIWNDNDFIWNTIND
jgi:hypothetical protein